MVYKYLLNINKEKIGFLSSSNHLWRHAPVDRAVGSWIWQICADFSADAPQAASSWYLDNTVLIAATIPRTAEIRSRNMVSVAGRHLLPSFFKHLNWFDSLHGCSYSFSRGLCLTFHCRCSDSVNHESLHCGVTIKRILSEDSIFYLCLYLKFRIWVINHPTL